MEKKKKYYFGLKCKMTSGKLDFTRSIIKKLKKNNIGNKNFLRFKMDQKEMIYLKDRAKIHYMFNGTLRKIFNRQKYLIL